MKETGTVKGIEGSTVIVSIEMHDGCQSCLNTACKKGRGALRAHNRNGLDLVPGDLVDIEIPGREQAKGAFWVLGLPVAGLFAGYGAGALIFPGPDEGPKVACSGALFLLALLIGMLVQKSRKQESLPVIVRKLERC